MKHLEFEKEAFKHSNTYLRWRRIATVSTAVFFIMVALLLLTACKDTDMAAKGVSGAEPVVTFRPATTVQCPTGGQVVEVDGADASLVCNGIQGPIGSTGATGPAGSSGSSSSVTVTPASASNCPNGGEVIEVNSVPSGVVCNGIDGAPGTDLTPVSIVQFCSGVTSYPNEFNEIGFCIDGKVYGTYSANDGFSSYLPPGAYSSNGINSSCTFTIGANCAISH